MFIKLNDILKEFKGKIPPEVYSSLQSLALLGVKLDDLKAAAIEEAAKYCGDNDTMERPKKAVLNLSKYYTVPATGKTDGPCYILSEDDFDDASDSISKRLKVFDYKKIIVPEDVAAALIDIDPNCFADCQDLQIIEEVNGGK